MPMKVWKQALPTRHQLQVASSEKQRHYLDLWLAQTTRATLR